jgi:hypothetical protein
VAGFTASEAITLQAETLFNLREAAEDGRVALDAETQAMIDMAEAQGAFEGLEDPMEEMLELQKMQLEVAAALAKVFGADLPESVRKYIDSLNDIPTVAGPPSGGSGVTHGPNLHGGESSGIEFGGEGMAGGGVSYGPSSGYPRTLHGTEGVVPLEGGGAAMIAQAIAQHMPGIGPLTVQLVCDRRVMAEMHIDMLRSNEGGIAAESARYIG